jgi:uncharacterized iron-regulated membrane protein
MIAVAIAFVGFGLVMVSISGTMLWLGLTRMERRLERLETDLHRLTRAQRPGVAHVISGLQAPGVSCGFSDYASG